MATTNFNLTSALNRSNKVVTRNGNKVVVVTKTNDKVIANVYQANKLSKVPTQVKYNLDGTLYGPNYEHPMDLFMA